MAISLLMDKRILVIGGSSGLGLAVAKHAGSLGARPVIISRNAEQRREELEKFIGGDIEVYSSDVESKDGMERTFSEIEKFDHLVITVRPATASGSFRDTDLAQVKETFETKFWGQYRAIKAALDHIDPGGSIVMTSGIAGEKIFGNSLAMAIINSATETLCRALAVELSPLRVNAVSPGFVEPKSDEIKQQAKNFPVKRIAFAEEVAASYIFLMENPYITGTTVVVDGGARLV